MAPNKKDVAYMLLSGLSRMKRDSFYQESVRLDLAGLEKSIDVFLSHRWVALEPEYKANENKQGLVVSLTNPNTNKTKRFRVSIFELDESEPDAF